MADKITTRLLRTILFGLLLIATGILQAQIDNVYVYGTVKDYNTAKKLDGVTVTVYKDGAVLNSVVTSANGKYEYNLDYGYDYKIVFSKPGIVGKNVSINTKGIPDEDRQGGLAMNVEMTLFQDIPGIDYSILQQPIGKSKYDPSTGMLAWDLQYTEQMRAELRRLENEYDQKKKMEANADAAFQKLLDQGNAAMTAKDYKKAVQFFTDALGMKAGDPIATARLSDAKIKLGELERAEQMEKQYADLIKEADALFTKKSYEDAKAKYTAALGVKEGEAYPKQRVKECDAFMADLAAKAEADKKLKELNDKYNTAVAAGDVAFKAAKYEEAKAKFTEAGGLKPDEKYPPQQLAAIASKLDELAKKAEADRLAKELDDQYNAAIKAGDAAFKSATYEEARTQYNAALGMKPKEKYPTDQLAAIEKKLAEQAAKAEADRQAKELNDRYNAAIAAADAAFGSADYDQARTNYNDALAIKPKEKYPTDQLAAITRKLDELAKKAEDERKAKELDGKYNAAVEAADAALAQQNYGAAKAKYNEALGLKPKEKYPADQLAAIAKTLADNARKAEEDRLAAERDAKYRAAVDQAEGLFAKQKYEEAIAQFQQASGIKPDEALPKERIAEIRALVDDMAKAAAAKRKQEELDARYNSLIAGADKNFKAKKHSDALNDYKDASQLKPDEQYPKDQIAAIEGLLDSAAKEKAEKERLEREKAEQDKQYNAFIAQADQDFKAKNYDAAANGYTSALEVKPGEKHPTSRLAEIQGLLAARAKADSLQTAEQERLAAEARRKAEEDSIKAARDAEEQARLEAERRSKLNAEQELEAQYNDAILKADAALRNKAWNLAREGYNEALAIKPKEKYPRKQLAAVDKAEADQLEADRKAAADAEAARLAEEERLRKDAEKNSAQQAELEQARQAREAQRALDERYNSAILQADNAMADKDYTGARDLYAQALDIKPGETYPEVKIGQIAKLLEEQERQRREKETAEQRVAEAKPANSGHRSMDNRKEQEAEVFMREAREREEAEKYLRIKRQKTALEEQAGTYANQAEDRHQAALKGNEDLRGTGQGLYRGDDALSKRNEEELENFRRSFQERRSQWAERGVQQTGEARTAVENNQADQRQRAISLNEMHDTGVQTVLDERRSWLDAQAKLAQAGRDRSVTAKEQLDEQESRAAQRIGDLDALAQGRQEEVELAKQRQEAQERQRMAGASNRGMANYEQLGTIAPNQKRSFNDYSRNDLASQYPQGVTEESYTEGNKVIIKRVVVQGNKADEYSKVIAKWGTFYFKNGHSISEYIWTLNTEQ